MSSNKFGRSKVREQTGRVANVFTFSAIVSIAITLGLTPPAQASDKLGGHDLRLWEQIGADQRANRNAQKWYNRFQVATSEAIEAGQYGLAAKYATRQLELVRSMFGDERGLSDSEFSVRFPLTSATGYEFIKHLHLSQSQLIYALIKLDRYDEAFREIPRSIYLSRRLFGGNSLQYVEALDHYALVAKAAGEPFVSMLWTTELTERTREMFGERSLPLARALIKLAILHSDLDMQPEAQLEAQEAIAVFKKLGTDDGREYRNALANLAMAYERSEDLDLAKETIFEIVRNLEVENQVNSLEYGGYLSTIARYLEKSGKFEAARRFHLAAMKNARSVAPEDEIFFALRAKAFANMLHRQGLHGDADVLFAEIAPIFDEYGAGSLLDGQAARMHLPRLRNNGIGPTDFTSIEPTSSATTEDDSVISPDEIDWNLFQ